MQNEIDNFINSYENIKTQKSYKTNFNFIIRNLKENNYDLNKILDVDFMINFLTNELKIKSLNSLKSYLKTISAFYNHKNIDRKVIYDKMKEIENTINEENSKKEYIYKNSLKTLKTKLKKIKDLEMNCIYTLFINYPPIRGQDYKNITRVSYKDGIIKFKLNKTKNDKIIKLNKTDTENFNEYFKDNEKFNCSYDKFLDNTYKFFNEKLTGNSFRHIYIHDNYQKIKKLKITELERENKLKKMCKEMDSSVDAMRKYYLQE